MSESISRIQKLITHSMSFFFFFKSYIVTERVRHHIGVLCMITRYICMCILLHDYFIFIHSGLTTYVY